MVLVFLREPERAAQDLARGGQHSAQRSPIFKMSYAQVLHSSGLFDASSGFLEKPTTFSPGSRDNNRSLLPKQGQERD